MTEQKNKLAEYQEKKDKILRMLEEIQIQIGDNELKDAIVQKQTKLKNDRFVVSVFGHFSNGKSTFLNALMGFGEEILTEDDAASTATITRLRYASEDEEICNKAEIEFSSGNTERVGIKELGEYVARNNSREVETTIKQVILYLNSELLKNGVEIVDTPGFNSTYKMHTETALRQVEESDAAIFLFNCENPGKTPEIEFLKKIQKYMDRVFFLMNKYEKSNSQGKEEMEDLKRKLKQQEIDMAGKEIYPISALEARKGIAERNETLHEHSNMDKFKSVLEDYLVSDENVTDRLLAPLTSIRGTLGQYKNSLSEQISACSKDHEELQTEIKKKKDEINRKEKEIKEKKRHIRQEVKSNISEAEDKLSNEVEKINQNVKEQLDMLKTKFDMGLQDFDSITSKVFDTFEEKWNETAEKLKDELMESLSESIDNEDYYQQVETEVARIIRLSLKINQITIEKPECDLSGLVEMEKKVEEARKKYKKIYEKSISLAQQKEERQEISDELEQRRKEYMQSRKEKKNRIEQLDMVQIEYGKEERLKETYVRRKNKIGQFFLGDKQIMTTEMVDVIDDRKRREADTKIQQIHGEMRSEKKEFSDYERKMKDQLRQSNEANIQDKLSEFDLKEAFEDLQKQKQTQEENSMKLEENQVLISKNSYLRDIRNEMINLKHKIEDYLDENKKGFVSMLCAVVEEEADQIERERKNIENLVKINDKTPEEIEKELEGFILKKQLYEDFMDKISKIQEEVA